MSLLSRNFLEKFINKGVNLSLMNTKKLALASGLAMGLTVSGGLAALAGMYDLRLTAKGGFDL